MVNYTKMENILSDPLEVYRRYEAEEEEICKCLVYVVVYNRKVPPHFMPLKRVYEVTLLAGFLLGASFNRLPLLSFWHRRQSKAVRADTH